MIYLATYVEYHYILLENNVYIIHNNRMYLIVSFLSGYAYVLNNIYNFDINQKIIIFNNKIEIGKRRYIKRVSQTHSGLISMLIMEKLVQEL